MVNIIPVESSSFHWSFNGVFYFAVKTYRLNIHTGIISPQNALKSKHAKARKQRNAFFDQLWTTFLQQRDSRNHKDSNATKLNDRGSYDAVSIFIKWWSLFGRRIAKQPC